MYSRAASIRSLPSIVVDMSLSESTMVVNRKKQFSTFTDSSVKAESLGAHSAWLVLSRVK